MSAKTPRAWLLAALNQYALASAAFDAHLDYGSAHAVSSIHYPALLQAKLALKQSPTFFLS